MGWWGKEPLAGDAPSDIKYDIQSMLGFAASFWDRMYKMSELNKVAHTKIRAKFETRLPTIIDYLEEKENSDYYDYYCIGYHVLAIMLMNCGATFPDWLRGQCIECCLNDSWAQKDESRFNCMISLIDDILEYKDGVPTQETALDEGLFAKLFTALDDAAAGKPTGLLNVGLRKGKG